MEFGLLDAHRSPDEDGSFFLDLPAEPCLVGQARQEKEQNREEDKKEGADSGDPGKDAFSGLHRSEAPRQNMFFRFSVFPLPMFDKGSGIRKPLLLGAFICYSGTVPCPSDDP